LEKLFVGGDETKVEFGRLLQTLLLTTLSGAIFGEPVAKPAISGRFFITKIE
jgi:hypothetical protein